MDLNDIKVGDIVKMSNGDIYMIGEIYKGLQYNLESTDGVSLKSIDIEKRLNKYHVGDKITNIGYYQITGTILKMLYIDATERIAYEVKWDNSLATYYIFEEEIIAMNEEKKVNFEVGDYVLIDSMNEYPKHFGYLGIIVSGSFVEDRWGVYFFALKDMIYVDEKFLIKSKYEYEIKPKIEISLKEAYKKYIESDINVTKQALNSYYGRWFFNPERYTNLKAELNRLPKIKKVIFNGPATIVLWADGDKTIVQCVEGDTMDKEKGLAMAICKKALGKSKTHYDYYNVFKKWIKEK